MGSPDSPLVANLYMEFFEEQALLIAPNPPSFWNRYIDDTFVVINSANVDSFFDHINSIDSNIKFTIERANNNQIPFLDVCVKIEDDKSLSTTIYRKPTHTDQYLSFESNHSLQHKRSVVRSLMDRAEKLITKEEDKTAEINHIKKVLQYNKYKPWTFKIPNKRKKNTDPISEQEENNQPTANVEDINNIPEDLSLGNQPTYARRHKPRVILPYVRNISEQMLKIYNAHGVQVCHKPTNKLRHLLV